MNSIAREWLQSALMDLRSIGRIIEDEFLTPVASSGLVEAERFIALLSREPFDYTEWRKTGLPDLELRELSKAANQYSRQLPETPKPATCILP